MQELLLGDESGEVLQLLHANAYTPGCYRRMCSYLGDYNIYLPEQRPLWPDSDPTALKSWDLLADDIISHMDKLGRRDVIGVGHSMGGVASWLAAIKRPDLFKRLVLIDPVVLPLGYFYTMSFLPYRVKKKYVPIIKIAARRRNKWVNRTEALTYLLSKKVFQRFDSDVLSDFVQYALKDTEEGVTLSYPRSWESHVYASPPNLWPKMARTPCPITIIRAEYSDVINDERWSKIQNKVSHGSFVQMDGAGHLVPFEQPEECAKVLRGILRS